MNTPIRHTASPGLLIDAADKLAAALSRAERLADETAWQCEAARTYRAELAEWIDRLRTLRGKVEALDGDARRAVRLAGAVA